jgi:hypothetical protein
MSNCCFKQIAVIIFRTMELAGNEHVPPSKHSKNKSESVSFGNSPVHSKFIAMCWTFLVSSFLYYTQYLCIRACEPCHCEFYKTLHRNQQ